MKTRLFVLLFIFSSSFSVFSQNTEVVKDIISGVDGSLPENLITFRDRLYFSAITEENGRELWVSDGTAIGTFLFKDISTPSLLGQDTNSNPSNFVVYNNKLYFSAFDETNGNELWETDGTVHGTKLAVDIFPGSGSSFPKKPICL